MANDKIQYALEKGTELHSAPKKLFGIPTGEERVYTIEKTLGQGGFGITYLATRKIGNIPQKFAIKEFFVKGQCWREVGNPRMMYPEAVEAKRDVKDWLHEFEKEAKLLNKICQKMPNIVQVNEVFRANDTAYYVMEYLEGGSLRDVVKEGALPEETALTYILPVVKAVYMLHTMEQPLLHCDIKHDNIMLRKHINGVIEPVLIDFGESRHFNEDGNLTTTHTTSGYSRGFAPLEQYLGITTFTPQVDVYALAATLYYLLTGEEPPFADDVTEERIRRKLPVALSDSLKGAIVHGMQKDKSKRVCDAGKFYKEVCGKDIDNLGSVKNIVSPELPIGYLLKNKGKQFEIVSVICHESYYIRYKATCIDEGKTSSYGQTQRIQFDIYEFFDRKNHRRQEDKSIIADGNTDASKKQFLSLCKKITKGEINGEFRNDSNLGWVTFASNNTFYIVDTHYKKPLPWKKMLVYVGVGMSGFLLVSGTISIYNNIKEASIRESREMSQRLIFLERPTDSIAILRLETARKEQAFDSLYKVAKKQYDDEQYLLAKKTINKVDSEFLSRQQVIELLENIEYYLASSVVPGPQKVNEEQVEPKTESKSDDDLYRDAIRKSDWKSLSKLANKGYNRAYYPLAKFLYAQKKYGEALTWIKKAVSVNADANTNNLLNNIIAEDAYEKAERYFKEKQWDKSLAYAKKAISLTNNHGDRLKAIISLSEKWNPPTYEINDYK